MQFTVTNVMTIAQVDRLSRMKPLWYNYFVANSMSTELAQICHGVGNAHIVDISASMFIACNHLET